MQGIEPELMLEVIAQAQSASDHAQAFMRSLASEEVVVEKNGCKVVMSGLGDISEVDAPGMTQVGRLALLDAMAEARARAEEKLEAYASFGPGLITPSEVTRGR